MLQLWPNSLDNTVSFASRKIVKLMQKGEKDLYYTRSKEGNIRGERRNMLSKIYVKWTVYDLFQDWQSRATMMYKRPKNIYKAPKNRVETVYKNISILFLPFVFFSFFHNNSPRSHSLLSFAKCKDWPTQLPSTIPPPVLSDLLVDEGRISPRIIQQGPRRDKRFLSGFAVVRRDNLRFSRVNSDSFTPSRFPKEISKTSNIRPQCWLESIDIFFIRGYFVSPSEWRNYRMEINWLPLVRRYFGENCETETGWRC